MLPRVTIAVPTYNEEQNIDACLRSIFSQDYPTGEIEVIVADDNSNDSTLEIARRYPVKIVSHHSKDAEAGKIVAFKKSTGELFLYLDADIHLKGKNWLKKMVMPLVGNKNITASFTRYYNDEHSSIFEKYLNLDPLQRDPVYQFFSPSIEKVTVLKKKAYSLCEYSKRDIPPAGLCLHRRALLKNILKDKRRFLELDILVELVEHGHTKFAYVPEAGLFHHHIYGLSDLLRKRSRNVTKVYLTDNETRKYRWFNLQTIDGLVRVALWTMIANSIIFPVISGLHKSVRYKNPVGLLDMVVIPLVTDTIIISFLLDSRGRQIFFSKK